jgi:hypothetical protein
VHVRRFQITYQPPQFSNLPNTSPTEARGARTQSGIMMTKKPIRNMTRIMPSNSGRCLAAKALNEIAKAPTAMVMSVPCLVSVSISRYVMALANDAFDSPDCRHIRRILHRGQDENDVPCLVSGRCDKGLPSQSREPSTDITQDLLHARRCKFRNPLILSSGTGRH